MRNSSKNLYFINWDYLSYWPFICQTLLWPDYPQESWFTVICLCACLAANPMFLTFPTTLLRNGLKWNL